MSPARALPQSTTTNLTSSRQLAVTLTSSNHRLSVTSASDTEPRRSQRVRQPSSHKIESDDYQASSRASSPAPRPLKPNTKSRSNKRQRGKPGGRPGRIVQRYADTWPASYEGSPELPSTAGPHASDSRLASPGPAGHEAPNTIDRAEAVRRASAYLGHDAARYSSATLQQVIAQIENPGEEVGSGPMEIETGSAPALRQSAGQVGLESRHQSPTGGIADVSAAQGAEEKSAAAHNAPAPEPCLVPPADNSDTEPESELEIIELRPNDSVSQRNPPIPRTSSHSSHPHPHPRASNRVRKAKPTYNPHADSDTNTVDESDTSLDLDTDSEEETMRSLKRQRIAPASQPRALPTRPDPSQLHQSLPRRNPSHPHVSSAVPAAPASSRLWAATINTPPSSRGLQEPPPLSD
ncbi:hypothetical protein FRC06_005426, partial [Ceratobasidium sp. 370]